MRIHYYQEKEDSEAYVVTLTEAKRYLKQQGGRAWTEHYERDGTMFETSPISIKGNHSNVKYNRHL